MKQPPVPVLKEWAHVGDEPHHSALPELLVVSQIFLIVQRPILFLIAPRSWGYAKTCQCFNEKDLSQRLDSGSLEARASSRSC